MPDFVIALLIILVVLSALAMLLIVLYFALFVRPKGSAPEDKSLLCDYAHRGLHSESVPENSLEAFRLAVEAGHGIELDVQLSRDGEVMVFHDYTLERMTGCKSKLSDLDASELSSLRLNATDQKMPTFAEVLSLVGGKVPLLVELKGESFDSSLCPKVASLLRDYHGSYCIESFNPLLIKEIKKELPKAYCGLLYTNVVRDKKKASPLNIAVSLMLLNFLCKPNFIAFNELDRKALPVKLATKLYRAQKFVWTVRSQESLDTAHMLGECPIFEHIER